MSFLFRYLRFHDIIGGIHVPVDDGVDKLNRKYTLLVFLFLALPIFTKQYIGDPIECFAPVYFAEHQSRYINSYCWTQSTYYMVPVGDPDDDGDQQEPPDRIMPDEVDYFIGFETVTHIGNERLRRVRVSYYQWAPLILLAQGLCFYIPFLIWNSCANNAGVKLRRLLKKASDIASLPPGCQQREALLAEFVDQFHTLVTGEAGWCADLQCGGGGSGGSGGTGTGTGGGGGSSGNSSASGSSTASGPGGPVANGQTGRGRGGGPGGNQNATDPDHQSSHHRGGGGNAHRGDSSAGCCLVSIPIIGSLISCCLKPFSWFSVGPSKYLCCLYLLVKSGYVFNVGLQFFLLGQFLGRGYLRHGLELINRLLTSGEWWASPRFPLSTLCQVRADMSGGLRSYTCQCVLPINVFNEKIFSVVWFYMAFLLPLNVLSLLFWIYRTFETNRMSYIRLCLWRTRLVELNQIHRTVRRLSQSYLGWDGVFLLRLIEHNHGSIMATLIMSRLWEFYANQIKLQEDANQMALASSAQHTLSQTTTAAISNQYHQFLTNQPHSHQHQHAPSGHSHHQQPQQVSQHSHQPSSGHHHGQPMHGVQGTGGQHHHHTAVGSAAAAAAGHHPHHNHSSLHGPGMPPMSHFTHTPLQPTQAGSGPQHPPPPPGMIGQHGHHSGQISQQPGHLPLHAANTAAAHHVHQNSLAAVAAAAAAASGGPHLSGAFTGPSASLLAQLQQAAHSNNISSAAASGPQQSQQSAGNVKAVAAALAAAAAATTTNSQQQTPQTKQVSGPGVAGGGQQAAANINLQPLKQQQGPNPGQPQNQAQSQQQQQASGSNPASNQVASTLQPQQPQQTSSSVTTSFITNTSAIAGATGAQAVSGPPLPPPPPAHVVAAVAAASSVTNHAAASQVLGQTVVTASPASRQVGTSGMATTGLQRQPNTMIGGNSANSQSSTVNVSNQPVPPPHNSLFNLKVSNIQATAGGNSPGGNNASQQTQPSQQQSRFPQPHTTSVKRS